jgi:hypothetical protein
MRPLLLTLALIVVGGLTVLSQPRAVYACSCVPPSPPLEARNQATAVFAGTVKEVAPSGPDSMSVFVTFDVQQSWKGPAAPQLTLITSNSSASCGYEFTAGEQYLVYGTAQEGRISASLCSRTAHLADAGEDLAALGPGTPVTAAPAPVTTETMGVPWVPILLIGAVALGAAAFFGPGLMRRRSR